MAAQSTWPYGPTGGCPDHPHDHACPAPPAPQPGEDQGQVPGVIGDMAQLLRGTRVNILASACMLASIAIGIALEAGLATRALQPGTFRVMNAGLMAGLSFSWVMAVTLLAYASRPVLHALSELRWVTGSPLDPRARWLTVPPVGANREEWTWVRAHLLLGAARLARYRVECAQTWTHITVSVFLAWTAIIIIGL